MNTSKSNLEDSYAQEIATSKGCCISSPLYARIVSGSVGSIITSLVVTPLEVVKVRMQASRTEVVPSNVSLCPKGCGTFILNNGQLDCLLPKSAVPFFDAKGQLTEKARSICSSKSPRGIGTFAMLRRIFQAEGFSGIYAGIRPTLVMAMPNTVLYFSAYDELIFRFRNSSVDPTQSWIPLVAGGSARLLASSVTAPFEFLRTRQASLVGYQEANPSMTAEFRLIVEKEGFGALYQGLRATLWRDVPFSAVYWFCLERLKLEWKSRNIVNEPVSPSEQAMQAFINGAASGVIAASMTTPFDVVKTRQQQMGELAGVAEAVPAVEAASAACVHNGAAVLSTSNLNVGGQSQRLGVFESLQIIYLNEGVVGLFRGNLARVLKVAPACAIMISSYEFGKLILVDNE